MKKGFTLIELIAVIIILGVLGLIATITISNELKESKERLYQIELDNIKNMARVWGTEHVFNLPSQEGEYIIITLGQLKEDGYANNPINPKTQESFSDNMQIKIKFINNNYIYEIIE